MLKHLLSHPAINATKNLWQSYFSRSDDGSTLTIDTPERRLIENIEDLVDLTAEDVMVPRADIVAIDVTAVTDEFLKLIKATPHSRIPVYQNSLDDILGFVHIKDVLQTLAQGAPIQLRDLMREVMIVSPALPALDLLVEMRKSHRNLAMIVDEYGGIDGLATMSDLVAAIVGEISDEHRQQKNPRIVEKSDGTILVDARYPISEFEKQYGEIFSENERDEADTLGGLTMFLAGHLPKRGELLTHESGVQIEVIDADARQLKRLRLRNIPSPAKAAASETAPKTVAA
jgi:CBS domain containing-hemolysin-like protein